MKFVYPFEKLDVWQLSKKLAVNIYKLTKSFPKDEKYGIISQINRASTSVAANIAEGSARIGLKDQSHFYIIAYSSLMELTSHLCIAFEIGYIKEEELLNLKEAIYEISNKLNPLHKSASNRYRKTTQRLNNSTTQQLNN
jgi:four helix bundle protein